MRILSERRERAREKARAKNPDKHIIRRVLHVMGMAFMNIIKGNRKGVEKYG